MKKAFLLSLIFISGVFFSNVIYAQLITSAAYTYARSGFAPTDITSGSTQLIGPNADDSASVVSDIGFTFWFAGTPYTQFSVSENGLMTLGNTRISGTDKLNLLASSTTLPKIAPYWDDLATGTNGYVIYKLTGTAPSRVLIITWYVTVPKNITGAANSTIQVQLSENGGTISFTYGTPAVPANTNQYSIGIGVSATDFASITPTSATAATCAYGTANNALTISPGQYTRYSFSTDITAPTITHTALTSTLLTTNRTFTATIADPKTGVPLPGSPSGALAPRVYYKKGAGGTYVSTQGVLTSGTGASGTWTFTIDYSLVGGVTGRDVIYYFIVAQDLSTAYGRPNIASIPAGVVATDVNTITTPPASPNRYKIGSLLSGTLTVGTTGADYQSLTNIDGLFEDINIGKLAGNLTINIVTDLASEAGTNALNAWTNDAGGPFTLTINPVGARTVSGTGTLIKLNGCTGVTIDGLNSGGNSLSIISSGGPAVQLSYGAANNIITNATLTGAGTGAISFYDASGTFTKNCSNNSITNCTIGGTATIHPTTGIYFGSWVSTSGTGNIINNNQIKDFVQYGIHLDRAYINTTISNNQIYHTFIQSTNYAYGIFMDLAVGATNIFNNRIYDLRATATYYLNCAMMGIFYRSGGGTDVINIYNNVISLDANYSTSKVYKLNGIQLGGAGTANVYYNSIYVGGTQDTSGNAAGFYRSSSSTVNFKNNIVFMARNYTWRNQYNKNYAVRLIATTNFVSDNNLIYANGLNSYLGYVGPDNNMGGTDYSTLSTWNTATGKDALSKSADPGLASTTTLAPDVNNPNSTILDGSGVPIATISTDILGAARSTAPANGPTDIGAYEFIPGFVLVAGNVGIAGATISWTDGIAKTVTSDGSGNYSIIVPYNWSGTITPSLTGYTFTPSSTTYTNLQSKHESETYTVAGTVYTISGNAGISGVTLSYTDGTPKTATSDGSGNYSLTVPYNWSGTVTPSKTNYAFTPASISYSNLSSDQTGQNYTTSAIVANVNLKAFLQGPFSAGVMTTALNTGGYIPLSSGAAYNTTTYGYTEKTVASIPNSTIVDWVIIELRTGTTAATKVAAQAAFIKSDGTVVDIDGASSINFWGVAAGNYYVVIRHRNHLAIMTSSAIPLSGSSALYDFSTASSKAYGVSPMKSVAAGVFAMKSGDANSNGSVEYNNDIIGSWKISFGLDGYKGADLNMDGTVDYVYDALQQWFSNFGSSTQVH